MTTHDHSPHTQPPLPPRLAELLADEALDQLSLEDQAELAKLRRELGSMAAAGYDTPVAKLLTDVASDAGSASSMPAEVRARLLRQGEALIAAKAGKALAASPNSMPNPVAGRIGSQPSVLAKLAPWLIAASILLAAGVGFVALNASRQASQKQQQLADLSAKYEALQASNREIVQLAEARLDELRRREGVESKLAAEQAKSVDLARQLAEASSALESAQKTIAIYQAPQDPATLARNRTELLAVPGTVRIAWAPFDLPDAPAEQRGVSGDVIWNDEKEQGYLRFVGLKVNDPKLEQYQVWVIDERGMEQKISGGIFNATADGEVIVPIKPGIDVRRVKLFAITIEEPGGTWVPNLKRRVVVAPREG
jgi:hypothetical protein